MYFSIILVSLEPPALTSLSPIITFTTCSCLHFLIRINTTLMTVFCDPGGVISIAAQHVTTAIKCRRRSTKLPIINTSY